MTADYRTTQAKIDNALDACGIGHDVNERLQKTVAEITEWTRKVTNVAVQQALHDALVNKPHGIDCDDRDQTPGQRAFLVGAINVLGNLARWDIRKARAICADILDDVNDHDRAAEVRGWEA